MSSAAAPADAEFALQGLGLACAYGQGPRIFSDIDIAIRPQEIVCLLGGSGCGKSTLLRAPTANATTGSWTTRTNPACNARRSTRPSSPAACCLTTWST